MEKKMVYIGRKADGTLVAHTDLAAMESLDGVTDVLKEIPQTEFEAAGGFVRDIDGEIFIGETEAEKQAKTNEKRVAALKRLLSETDYIAAKIAEGSATKASYSAQITERHAWREEINQLQQAS